PSSNDGISPRRRWGASRRLRGEIRLLNSVSYSHAADPRPPIFDHEGCIGADQCAGLVHILHHPVIARPTLRRDRRTHVSALGVAVIEVGIVLEEELPFRSRRSCLAARAER